MTRPTLHLCNFSGRRLHGPGRLLCAMAAPRGFERGVGKVLLAMPAVDDLRDLQAGRIALAEYRARFERYLSGMERLNRYRPGDLFFVGRSVTSPSRASSSRTAVLCSARAPPSVRLAAKARAISNSSRHTSCAADSTWFCGADESRWIRPPRHPAVGREPRTATAGGSAAVVPSPSRSTP